MCRTLAGSARDALAYTFGHFYAMRPPVARRCLLSRHTQQQTTTDNYL